MSNYSLWRIGANDHPEEIIGLRDNIIERMRDYCKNLQTQNPRKAYWIYDNINRRVVF